MDPTNSLAARRHAQRSRVELGVGFVRDLFGVKRGAACAAPQLDFKKSMNKPVPKLTPAPLRVSHGLAWSQLGTHARIDEVTSFLGKFKS